MIACIHEELAVLMLLALGVLLATGCVAAGIAWQVRRGDRATRRRYQRELYRLSKTDTT